MTPVEFSVQMIGDQFTHVTENPDVPLLQLLPSLVQKAAGNAKIQPLAEYKVLVAYRLNITSTTRLTLKDIQLPQGGYILLVEPTPASVQLSLHLPQEPAREGLVAVNRETLIGRLEDDKERPSDLDLTQYLKNPLKISRQQAWLREQNGRWMISLHVKANSPIYVNQVRLEKDQEAWVNDGTVIGFGGLPESPELRLVATYLPQ